MVLASTLGQRMMKVSGKFVFLVAIAMLLTQADCRAVESDGENAEELKQAKKDEQILLDHYLKQMAGNSIGPQEIEKLANRYALLGKPEEEEKLCRKYLKLLRTTGFYGRHELQTRMAKVLISEQKYKEAEEIYREQIKEESFHAPANINTYALNSYYVDLAWLYVLQDRFAEAAQFYKLAAENFEKDQVRSSEARKCWDAYNSCLSHSNQPLNLWFSQGGKLLDSLGKLSTNLLSFPPGLGYLVVFAVKTIIGYPVVEVIFPQKNSAQRQKLAIAVFLCSTLFILGLYFPVSDRQNLQGFGVTGISAFVISFGLPPFVEVLYLYLLSRTKSTFKVIGWLFFLNFISVLGSLALQSIFIPLFYSLTRHY